ncbi:hypothetical protein DFA_03588 [Cavenderia fasciculata]|uniref:Uncharacterized protein n=1 Tax=Cavenderia fasciculata TaxID=261658 RepID=F4PI56_CACFS|nr:uncharacterized protein DFA_03588 [Cavenderia fasciculata]EGG25339.1 hypothetical protein DFA_03588 [Cavenderia fasciculata]|eukprot:XP_004363190.1 hypothetical protein DFA_03588 [Cavenderia fasciculata]
MSLIVIGVVGVIDSTIGFGSNKTEFRIKDLIVWCSKKYLRCPIVNEYIHSTTLPPPQPPPYSQFASARLFSTNTNPPASNTRSTSHIHK